MKARIKETGEAYYVTQLYLGNEYRYNPDDVEILTEFRFDKSMLIDWEKRRFELVKAAMQGLCANPNVIVEYGEEPFSIEGKAVYIVSRVLNEYMKLYKK